MESKHKTIAFIPLRGGSRSIPFKNIKEMNGRPLVYWVLDAAAGCGLIDEVYVSTDSGIIKNKIDEYKEIYRNNLDEGKLLCIERSAGSASDTASTEMAMLEFAAHYDFQNIVLIQATSPMLTKGDLTGALNIYREGGFDSLLSVVRQKRFIWGQEEGGRAFPMNYDPLKRPMRQQFEGYLVENGAFYITSRELLLSTECRISGNIGHYEMEDESYFEIDEPSDWIIAEQLLKKRSRSSDLAERIKKIKLLAMDCDGVLTDGGMYYTKAGDELKKFNAKDGMGIGLLHKRGIITAVITGENTAIVTSRAKKLGIENVFLGCGDKLTAMKQLLKERGLTLDEAAFIGDDINDTELLRNVGVSFSVSDAMECVKSRVDYVTVAKGGHGAVREAAELILGV
ncbi:N-acylneuraminate cytidylyltransferase [Anaerobacterium chartisolvens]|uniref:N-acylneuraminate cytidylyltransferase n=1 Tax=Anaerobacterium chartisolvens TaxID=1297424 RepID=A0A369BHX7_9FIRM|nr:acylneuraminate cytidylyltransferase [Anaerobacterium chartisolvens]RCX20168.1 N-acylneuraminate cytidylyltransferase [Anaerobacterium chartisolvens]